MGVPPLRGAYGRNVAPCRALHEIMCDRLSQQESAVTNCADWFVPPPGRDGKSCHTPLAARTLIGSFRRRGVTENRVTPLWRPERGGPNHDSARTLMVSAAGADG